MVDIRQAIAEGLMRELYVPSRWRWHVYQTDPQLMIAHCPQLWLMRDEMTYYRLLLSDDYISTTVDNTRFDYNDPRLIELIDEHTRTHEREN